MTRKIKKILLLSLILTVGYLMISTASAATVNNNMTSTDIQNVIDTTPDTTLTFSPGDYDGISLVINKSLTLEGTGATLNNTVNGAVILNVTNTNNVVIDGFTINGGRAIVVNTVNNINITNNVITMMTTNDAITLTSVQGALLEDNVIFGDGIGRDAIGLVNSSNINIIDNTITDFTRNGISLAAGFPGNNATSTFNVLILENTISNIGQEGIFFGGGVSHVEIIANNFTAISTLGANAINIARSTTDILIEGNIILGNFVGIRIEEGNTFHNGTPTVLTNVTITSNFIALNVIGILLVNVTNSTGGLTLNGNAFFNNLVDIA